MGKFAVIDDLKDFQKLIEESRASDDVHILRYGGPCKEKAEVAGSYHVFYGAPCKHLDSLKLEEDEIRLKYGVPCTPPYIITKYGGPCKEC